MTLPSAGGNNPPISIKDINGDTQDGFGLGFSLSAYRGTIYDDKSGGAGVFSSTSIRLSDFYGKRRVDAGARSVTSSGNQVVPPYRTITLYAYGGSGGGGGGKGFLGYAGCVVSDGSSGSAGEASTIGPAGTAWAATAQPGREGTGGGKSALNPVNGANADAGSPVGGASGDGNTNSNGNPGGNGGKATVTLTNPVLGGSGPVSGQSVAFYFGAAGKGGAGSAGYGIYKNGGWTCDPNGGNGSGGTDGSPGYGGMTWT